MDQITLNELLVIFKDCKKSRFEKEPDFDLVVSRISDSLDVPVSEGLKIDIKNALREVKKVQEKNRSLKSTQRLVEDHVCLLRKNYMKKVKRQLEEVGERQQRRRMSDFISATNSRAKEENTSPSTLYAFGLKNDYLKNKEFSKVGKSILNDELSSSFVPVDVASAIFESGKLSKRSYIDIRLLLKGAGADVLPPYAELDRYRKNRRPIVEELPSLFEGVKYDYLQSLKLTSSQLINSLKLPIFSNLQKISLTIHDGLDGSGGHSIFNQVKSTETNNIIMYMFCIENMKDSEGRIIWENNLHGSSSSCRPVMLLMGKETRDNCKIVSQVQLERQGAKFSLDYMENQIEVEVNANMSMVDGKLHSLVTGLGGAFCCLCTYSKEECSLSSNISQGFKINRSLEQTLKICEQNLHLEKNRAIGDYEKRKGVTQDPITTEDMNNLHPLHNLLRCFGWLFKICYHATAGHLSWSEAKLDVSNRVSRALEFMKNAKEEIQLRIKQEASITLERPDPTGHGGTSTTGNIAKEILNTSYRKLLTQGISNNDLREKIDKIVLNMAVILTIINSNRNVNIDEYREFCRTTYLQIAAISWIEFSPSVHYCLGT